MPSLGLILISEPDGNPSNQAVYKLIVPNGSTSITDAVCTLNLASSSEVTALGDKTIKAMYFATISSGTTSGTITKPASGTATFVMDEWGTDTDALLTTLENGKPTFISPVDASGNVVGTSFNTSGEYSFDGTPSPAADHALVYIYTCKLSDFISSEDLFESEKVETITGRTVSTKTDNYQITTADFGKSLRMNHADAKTFTLPSVDSTHDGKLLYLYKIGAGNMLIARSDSDTIGDGSDTSITCTSQYLSLIHI